ncbi:MAG: sugar phosphate isomerase/epimerase family protein [Candidatus Excrementavichristensenella sp.]|jgi:sugar phosphate isomerase/epimerase
MAFQYDLSEYVASTWTLYHRDVADALDICRAHGFDQVEIWADLVHLDPRVGPDVRRISAHLKKNAQTVHSIHLPILHTFPHPSDEQQFFAYRLSLHKQCLDWAERLKCSIAVLHAFDPRYYPYTLEQLDLLRERIDLVARYAAERGIRIAIENLPYKPQGDQLVTTLADQRNYFEGLDVWYCLDIGHVPLLGLHSCEQEIDATADRLITFHVHNNHGQADDHNLPNDGLLDWPAIHARARAAGYKGFFVLEVNERGDGEKVLEHFRNLCR